MDKNMILSRIRNGLIISSQAEGDEPLNTPEILSAMAKAGIAGGAVAVRAERPPNVEFMKKALDVPIIGLSKVMYPDSEVYITPTLSDALAVLEAGADIIAMDATNRARPNGETLQDIINELRNRSDVLLMADISTLEEGLMAYEAGFDMISTTLSGYTSYTKKSAEANAPDMKLLISLKRHLGDKIPIIAEGRIWTSSQAVEAFQRGAYSVVIGTAITRPTVVTRQIVREIEKYHHFKEQMTIGIDLGGTRTAIGLISYGGAIHEKHVLTTPWESGMNHMVQIIGNQVVDMIRHTPHNIEIIGIAATGRVDQSRGIIFDGVPIIKDYIGYPLAEKVSQYSDRPVFVENDANAAALAEYRALKDRPERFVLITLGTGIGGGIVTVSYTHLRAHET